MTGAGGSTPSARKSSRKASSLAKSPLCWFVGLCGFVAGELLVYVCVCSDW